MPAENKQVVPLQREDRYIVIKRSDLETIPNRQVVNAFLASLAEVSAHSCRIPQRQFLVIESDWPEHEPAWQMIERRMTGQPPVTAAEELEAVRYWRGKHTQAIRERDALQLLLNERDEQNHSLEQRRQAEQQACQAAERRVVELQSELTKARGLLTDARAVVATSNWSNWSSRLLQGIDAFLADQSAPADKGQGEPVLYVEQWELDRIAKGGASWATAWKTDGMENPSRPGDCVAFYAEQPAPVAVELADRSPENYAIEHAEYMAKSADDVLAKFQAYGVALLAVDEGGDDGEGELFDAIDSARGDLQESLVDLRGMVHEFRKRSNRCKSL